MEKSMFDLLLSLRMSMIDAYCSLDFLGSVLVVSWIKTIMLLLD